MGVLVSAGIGIVSKSEQRFQADMEEIRIGMPAGRSTLARARF